MQLFKNLAVLNCLLLSQISLSMVFILFLFHFIFIISVFRLFIFGLCYLVPFLVDDLVLVIQCSNTDLEMFKHTTVFNFNFIYTAGGLKKSFSFFPCLFKHHDNKFAKILVSVLQCALSVVCAHFLSKIALIIPICFSLPAVGAGILLFYFSTPFFLFRHCDSTTINDLFLSSYYSPNDVLQ